MKSLLAAAALLLAPVSAHAEDWVLISVAEGGAGAMFVDADSVKSEGNIRTARVLGVLREDMNGVAAGLGELSFDCAARTRRIDKSLAYDAQGRLGPPEAGQPWRALQPKTSYYRILEVLCGEAPMDGRRFGAGPPIAAAREMLKN